MEETERIGSNVDERGSNDEDCVERIGRMEVNESVEERKRGIGVMLRGKGVGQEKLDENMKDNREKEKDEE